MPCYATKEKNRHPSGHQGCNKKIIDRDYLRIYKKKFKSIFFNKMSR